MYVWSKKHCQNKKVLLCERKKHTARTYQVSHHLLSYPGRGGTPSLAGEEGVPHPWLGVLHSWLGAVPHPWLGVPHPGYTPSWPGQGVPCPGVPPTLIRDWGTPWEGTWDQSLGYPQKGHGTSRSIMRWRWGTPWVWTDRHLWKQYLPVILRTRVVIMDERNKTISWGDLFWIFVQYTSGWIWY